MVRLIRQGFYSLIEAKGAIKVLILDDEEFVWINAEKNGDILINSNFSHRAQNLLARGGYRLYKVKGESNLTGYQHLELFNGDGKWQGYLLPAGLPDDIHVSDNIISTQELITKSFK